jgi:hypothetical protein
MNKRIRREIFRVLKEECDEERIDIGGLHVFNFCELFNESVYAVTITIQEIGDKKEYRVIDKTGKLKRKRVFKKWML